MDNIMDKLTSTETIIALEIAALEAWHNGNPSPFLDLYSKGLYFISILPMKGGLTVGQDKELYESMRER